jgi:hypothetical protein
VVRAETGTSTRVAAQGSGRASVLEDDCHVSVFDGAAYGRKPVEI